MCSALPELRTTNLFPSNDTCSPHSTTRTHNTLAFMQTDKLTWINKLKDINLFTLFTQITIYILTHLPSLLKPSTKLPGMGKE